MIFLSSHSRFAAHLSLDEKANQVAMTALRLVARMKRDWIVAGKDLLWYIVRSYLHWIIISNLIDFVFIFMLQEGAQLEFVPLLC